MAAESKKQRYFRVIGDRSGGTFSFSHRRRRFLNSTFYILHSTFAGLPAYMAMAE